jgi:putative spermidine/putrescine transport system substrate-binding protein
MEQGGAKGIDIVQLDDFDLVSAGNKGYLSSISSKNIGDFKNLYPQAKLYGKNRKLYGIANVFGAWGIAYNPKKVSKPTSWNDLLNKKYSGKVTAMSQYLPDILMVSRANGGNYKNMSPAWKFYKKLTPNVAKYYTSFSDPESLFESGDVEIASWFSGRAEALKEEGKSVDFVIPKEGGELIRSVLGIVKTSKNKKLDEELIEYSLRQKAQVAFAKDLYYGPTNKKIKIPSYISKDVVNQKEIERLYAPNWNKVLKYSGSWYTKQTALTTSK